MFKIIFQIDGCDHCVIKLIQLAFVVEKKGKAVTFPLISSGSRDQHCECIHLSLQLHTLSYTSGGKKGANILTIEG